MYMVLMYAWLSDLNLMIGWHLAVYVDEMWPRLLFYVNHLISVYPVVQWMVVMGAGWGG